jgi:hypothetical protein
MLSASLIQRKREKKAARRRALQRKRYKIISETRGIDGEVRYQRFKLKKHLRRIRRKIKKGKAPK